MKTEYITTIAESQSFIFEGVSVYIWDKYYSITEEKIEVMDPIYHQKYLFNIWTILLNDKLVKFAIGEFSNSIYGIYLVK
ncbi:hypothetical protein [Riemerella anatipestifer]|uniref:hypothetical protein n=1 Tax=Riemerella anatipestifer TaxID=34085 RepID=UPI001BDB61AB|nr:hypothetical protein [Riemerella anatipestifer]MBT0552588.1 hypothetical protein [Riemerella anatipestifer]MBT0554895.1 hypothetical protein [Riemerella anatipestifer]MCU7543452.1 hypothetical protein [Riemerella anatipestifer]MCU7561060.1 hypothetical protein [Riemerella anatipestifer]MCW0514225.1 hypothetical protein [Riemerella anatipestifer]